MQRSLFAAFLIASLGAPTAAFAADEEIQVYMDEINPAGKVGLDVHLNYVADGDGTLPYAGAESPLHRWRITPEFSLGLGGGFELGAYLPLATIARDGMARAEGVKGRLKWLAPHKETGFYWGLNWEIGRVEHRLDENPWNSEIKVIGGWRDDKWQLGVNLNFDFKVAGPVPAPATLEVATRLGYKVTPGLTLGLESYNELGELKGFGPLSQTEHKAFVTADFAIGGFDVQAGLGKGYGSNADDTVIKVMIGVPLGN